MRERCRQLRGFVQAYGKGAECAIIKHKVDMAVVQMVFLGERFGNGIGAHADLIKPRIGVGTGSK